MSTTTLSDEEKWRVATDCVHLNLKRTVRSVTQQFNAVLAQKGLRITQFTLLITSSLLGSVPLTELAEVMSLDRTTLTRNLKPLEQKGLVHSETSAKDVRVRLVQTTEAGEMMVAQCYPLWLGVQEKLTKEIEPEQYRQLLAQMILLTSAE